MIFTGRESTEEMERERVREIEQMKADGNIEEHIIPPIKPWKKYLLKTWGWLAFLTGIVLLGFIVISMLL